MNNEAIHKENCILLSLKEITLLLTHNKSRYIIKSIEMTSLPY